MYDQIQMMTRQRYNRKNDIRYLKLLHVIGNILALVPFYDFENNSFVKRNYYKLYSAALAFIVTVSYVESMVTKISKFSKMATTTIVLFSMSKFSLALSLIIPILSSSFWNMNEWKSFLTLFSTVDRVLENKSSKNKRPIIFYIELVVGHIYFLLILTYGKYTAWTMNDLSLITENILQYVEYYCIFIYVMLIFNFTIALKHRFINANIMLSKAANLDIETTNFKNNIVPLVLYKPYNNQVKIRNIWRVFSNLGDLIDTYNTLFGWHILLLMTNIVVEILQAFDLLVVYAINVGKSPEANTHAFIIGFIQSTMLLIFGIIIIVSCDNVTKEAQQTSVITYKLLLDLPIISKDKEELILLAQQTSSNSNSFSAAGFFDVNVSILLSLFGCVTSNLIIIIQLNQ